VIHRKTSPTQDGPFRAGPILKADPPAGADGTDWHRYEITQGESSIVGYRQGSQQNVREAVEEIVCQLNQRARNTGRGVLVSPNKKGA